MKRTVTELAVFFSEFGCVHTKSDSETKTQHFPITFNDTSTAVTVSDTSSDDNHHRLCAAPKVEADSTLWSRQYHFMLRQPTTPLSDLTPTQDSELENSIVV